MRKLWRMLVLPLAAVILWGCGHSESSGPPQGSPAPEIAGNDLDGVPLRLSDFRGKVVLLSFWADG